MAAPTLMHEAYLRLIHIYLRHMHACWPAAVPLQVIIHSPFLMCATACCLQTACILTVDVHCEATSFECVVVQLKGQEGEAVRPCQSFQRLQTHTQTHSAPVIEDIDWAIKCYQGLS